LTGVAIPFRELERLADLPCDRLIESLRGTPETSVLIVRGLAASPYDQIDITNLRRASDHIAEQHMADVLKRGDIKTDPLTVAVSIDPDGEDMRYAPTEHQSKCLILLSERIATYDILHEYSHCLIGTAQRRLGIVPNTSAAPSALPSNVEARYSSVMSLLDKALTNMEISAFHEGDLGYLFFTERKGLHLPAGGVRAQRILMEGAIQVIKERLEGAGAAARAMTNIRVRLLDGSPAVVHREEEQFERLKLRHAELVARYEKYVSLIGALGGEVKD